MLEDVRLGYSYYRRTPGPIKAIISYNKTLNEELKDRRNDIVTLHDNQKFHYEKEGRLEKIINSKDR